MNSDDDFNCCSAYFYIRYADEHTLIGEPLFTYFNAGHSNFDYPSQVIKIAR
jgi:hypothetical protein